MKWFLIIAVILLLPILVILVAGLFQPVKHSVTRSLHLNQKPEVVFALLADSTNLPSWSSTVASVESIPAQDGKPVVKCTLKWGHMQMVMTQNESTSPSRLVITMSKPTGTVLGTWTYQIKPDTEGCRVTLTERRGNKESFLPCHGPDARPGREYQSNFAGFDKKVR